MADHNIANGSQFIPDGLPVSVMRQSMENKNQLNEKGGIHVGTGTTQSITVGGDTYTIANTSALKPDGSNDDKKIIRYNSSTELGVEIIDPATTADFLAYNATNASNVYGNGKLGTTNGETETTDRQPDHIFEENSNTVKNATNVTTNINGHTIVSIFENDGVTVKNATNASNVSLTGCFSTNDSIMSLQINAGTGQFKEDVPFANTTQYGVTKLIDDLTTDSSVLSLTAKQGKVLNDTKVNSNTKIEGFALGNTEETITGFVTYVNGKVLDATNASIAANNIFTNISPADDAAYTVRDALGVVSDAELADYHVDTDNVAIGNNSSALSGGARYVLLGANATVGNNGAALGFNAIASGSSSIALGSSAEASGDCSIALGVPANASGLYSTALGYQANASGIGSTALGSYANAIVDLSTALGYKANASADDSTAIGFNAIASGKYSTALGFRANASTVASTALGSYANASGLYSTALGYYSNASGNYSTALGYYSNASGNYSIALEYYSNASGNYSTALGFNSKASGINSVALGYYSKAIGQNSTALGGSANASRDHSTALGYKANASADDSIAIGFNANASGVGSTSLRGFATAIGTEANASGWGSTALGGSANASRDHSTALGYQANASGIGSTALGGSANAIVDLSTAIGFNASGSADCSTAIGFNANASGKYSTALGYKASVTSDNTIQIGSSSNTEVFYYGSLTPSGGSDARIKEDINPANTSKCLEKINNIELSTYRYKNFTGLPHNLHLGWIADDVEPVIPEAVSYADKEYIAIYDNGSTIYENDSDTPKKIKIEKQKYLTLLSDGVPYLWGAVQELSKIVDESKQKIIELENRVSILENNKS